MKMMSKMSDKVVRGWSNELVRLKKRLKNLELRIAQYSHLTETYINAIPELEENKKSIIDRIAELELKIKKNKTKKKTADFS